MANSQKARDVLDAIRDDDRITGAALSGPLSAARSALRDLDLAASGVQWDLDDVDDEEDKRTGIVEMGQKIGGLKREVNKLRDQLQKVERIVAEVDDASREIKQRLADHAARQED